MSASAGRAKLSNATKNLLVRWEQTREVWTDAQAARFEQRVMSRLEPRVHSALSAMERLGGLLAQAERECGRGGDGIFE